MVEKETRAPAAHDGPVESPAWIIAIFIFVLAFLVVGVLFHTYAPAQKDFRLWTGLLGLLATVGIFSVLYRENPVFRLFEHIFVGLSVGYGIAAAWFQIMLPQWYYPMMPRSIVGEQGGGMWLLFLALPMGLLFFTVYFPRISWMNRFILSILMGWAAGNALQQFIGSLAPQIVAAFRAPITRYNTEEVRAGLNNITLGGIHIHLWWLVSIVVLTCTMAYFFFSIDHKRAGWVREPAKVGRYFIMIALGTIFGTTVMGRFSLLIERLDTLMNTINLWKGVLAYWFVHHRTFFH